MEERKVTVTSALPYVHGVPHLGNMAGSVLPAELLHRYFDLKGIDNEFICGGDVHGTPLELEAIERGVAPEEIKDEQNRKVEEAYDSLNVDFSIFSDTHSKYNRKQTHDMFEELYCRGLIKQRVQTMPYCRNDDRFLPDRYIEGKCPHCGGLARGDQCDDCGKLVEPEEINSAECQICGGTEIEFRETTHLFLDLNEYRQEIREWIENEEPIPENMENQVLHDLEEAEDRSITRDQDWGFRVPVERVNKRIREDDLDIGELDPETYEEKVLYVWFDAPIGYIGFTREFFEDSDEWKKHWDSQAEIYYSIGKDNAIFHTVIWPTMLLGSRNEDIEYGLPEYEFIQQYLMWQEGAFSKSRDRGIFIDEAVDYYPADYWRFYLARMLPTDHDTNFSWQDFEDEINNVLNDTVGNFVNRTLSLAEKWFDNTVPEADLKQEEREIMAEIKQLLEDYEKSFDPADSRPEVKDALDSALEIARTGDRYLSEEEPWNNEERREETIYICLKIIDALAATLHPFIPESSEKIAEMLELEIDTSETADQFEKAMERIGAGHELGEREILFEKIDTSEYQKEMGGDEHEFNDETVSFEDFQEMDIRIGRVESVEDHPDADRLYRISLNLGSAELQTCAGLKNHYSKEELEGRKVVVLANLEPTELRGEKSECMMLAAESEDGEMVKLLEVDEEMEVGSEVK
ncbi:MAG: methionine--tRNA ligase [Candidatus Nanohaloarchaea archaeon]